jgi:hypothetical protein
MARQHAAEEIIQDIVGRIPFLGNPAVRHVC